MTGRIWRICLVACLALFTTCAIGSRSLMSSGPISVSAGPTPPWSSFTDGTWRINVDILPGIYTTIAGPDCYWQRLRDLSGRYEAMLQTGGPYRVARLAVTILPTDGAFHAAGCGRWVRSR